MNTFLGTLTDTPYPLIGYHLAAAHWSALVSKFVGNVFQGFWQLILGQSHPPRLNVNLHEEVKTFQTRVKILV